MAEGGVGLSPIQMQALTQHLENLMRRQTEEIHDRLDQLENRNNSDNEGGRPRRIRDAPRPARIEGVKLHIPPFKGKSDPEAYLEWELKIEHVFSCNSYKEDQKVNLAAAAFSNYAHVWWVKLERDKKRNDEPLIKTWSEMRTMMRKRYAHSYYLQELHKKSRMERIESQTKEFLRRFEKETKEFLREKRESEKRQELKVKEKESEKKKELRKKENEIQKNEELRKDGNSEGPLFSCKEVDLNSNDLSLPRDAEFIFQGQESCDLSSTMRIENHVSLIPSAPLATKPTFMCNLQEAEQGIITLFSSSAYVAPNDSHVDFPNNEISDMRTSCCSFVVKPCTSESDFLCASKVDLHKTLRWHEVMNKDHKESHYFHRKQFASATARKCLNYNSKTAFVNFYLDEYGVWHMGCESLLTIEFAEHEYLQGLIAITRFVFDPGGTKELNSRTNSLEEGGNDVILKGHLKIEVQISKS